MKIRIFKFIKKHIYVFGILANIVPIIGMVVMLGVGKNWSFLNHYQLWAWISGAIYYIFMWSVALKLWKHAENAVKESDEYAKKIKALEKRVEDLEKK